MCSEGAQHILPVANLHELRWTCGFEAINLLLHSIEDVFEAIDVVSTFIITLPM